MYLKHRNELEPAGFDLRNVFLTSVSKAACFTPHRSAITTKAGFYEHILFFYYSNSLNVLHHNFLYNISTVFDFFYNVPRCQIMFSNTIDKDGTKFKLNTIIGQILPSRKHVLI